MANNSNNGKVFKGYPKNLKTPKAKLNYLYKNGFISQRQFEAASKINSENVVKKLTTKLERAAQGKPRLEKFEEKKPRTTQTTQKSQQSSGRLKQFANDPKKPYKPNLKNPTTVKPQPEPLNINNVNERIAEEFEKSGRKPQPRVYKKTTTASKVLDKMNKFAKSPAGKVGSKVLKGAGVLGAGAGVLQGGADIIGSTAETINNAQKPGADIYSNIVDAAGTAGTVGGASLGAGIGLMFGGPIGALIGLGIGSAAGSILDKYGKNKAEAYRNMRANHPELNLPELTPEEQEMLNNADTPQKQQEFIKTVRENMGITQEDIDTKNLNRRAQAVNPKAPKSSVITRTKNEEIINAVMISAKKYGVDPNLVFAVIQQESGFNPKAVSKVGAQGLMQLMPNTAKGLGVTDSFNIQQNIDGGTKMLSNLLQHYNGDVTRALAAYNAGMYAVDDYMNGTNLSGQNPLKRKGVMPWAGTGYPETKNYVNRILANYKGDGKYSPNGYEGYDNVQQASTGTPQSTNAQQVEQPQTPVQNAEIDLSQLTPEQRQAYLDNQRQAVQDFRYVYGMPQTDVEKNLQQQLVDNTGYVSQQDMFNRLNNTYQDYYNMANADPRYSGEVLTPEQPYQIDPFMANYARAMDNQAIMKGIAPTYQQNLADAAKTQYQMQLAQQAGVPYADYINALTDRRKAMIEGQLKQAEQVLTFQANQTTDMSKKLEYLQKIEEIREKTIQAMMVEDLKAKNEIEKANVQGRWNLANTGLQGQNEYQKQQLVNQGNQEVQSMKTPYQTMMGESYLINSLQPYLPHQRAGIVANLGDTTKLNFFGTTQPDVNQIAGFTGYNPQQTQQQSAAAKFIDWIKGGNSSQQRLQQAQPNLFTGNLRALEE